MTPTITAIIERLQNDKTSLGITLYNKASENEIASFERAKGIKLPDDIKEFYRFCNGFESEEDMFRIIPLGEIVENGRASYLAGKYDFHIAENMIYCDMWTISVNRQKSSYSIYHQTNKFVVLTNSFAAFLDRFLTGGVFDGLYTWEEELR